MNELSLFTGAGGGVLGTHHLLGWKTCGYVEWNEYCQRVIAARIADGYLTSAPIFTDVREFVQSGAARQYRGVADVVSAGFPCQPFSVAGKQLAADDERNMWPATRDVIRIVQPASVLLENVPGLVSCGYLGTVIADLAALGYVGAGELSELPTPERHTSATGSGLWPTPTTPNGGRSVKHVTDWRSDRTAYHNGKKVQVDLNAAVRMWPTPTATDYKGAPTGETLQARMEMTRGVRLCEEVARGQQTPRMTLNPAWVEWLMGWPIGWTDLKPLVTVKFQQWLHAHGRS
jgi:DNA (cytosine-5)-methyltransferase 1